MFVVVTARNLERNHTELQVEIDVSMPMLTRLGESDAQPVSKHLKITWFLFMRQSFSFIFHMQVQIECRCR